MIFISNQPVCSNHWRCRNHCIRDKYTGSIWAGLEETNDHFRGISGAFQRALEGIRNCQAAGIKVGLRFTMNRRNAGDIAGIFDLVDQENIPRVCFYHLVYAGRGSELINEDLSHQETRDAVDLIIDRTQKLHAGGKPVEVLTVDNHCDGPYLYLRLMRENPERAGQVLKLLEYNGGNSSGVGVSSINWDGYVFPDQFWRNHILGNVRSRSFGEIWTDPENTFLMKLKSKKKYVTGRCAGCKFLDVCGGNFRARAEAVTGDVWAPDPECYLTDGEIGN